MPVQNDHSASQPFNNGFTGVKDYNNDYQINLNDVKIKENIQKLQDLSKSGGITWQNFGYAGKLMNELRDLGYEGNPFKEKL